MQNNIHIEAITYWASNDDIIVFVDSSHNYPFFYYFKQDKVEVPSINTGKGDTSVVSCLNISQCGKYVIVGYKNGKIIVWDAKLRIDILSYTVEARVEVVYAQIQKNSKYLIVSLNNFHFYRFVMIYFMDYLMLKFDQKNDYDSRITDIKMASPKDSFVNLIAIAFQDKVIILKSENELVQIASFSFDNPKIDFIGDNCTFNLLVLSKKTLYLKRISDNGDYDDIMKMEIQNKINYISFLTSDLILICSDEIIIYHISGKEIAKIPPLNDSILKVNILKNNIVIFPCHKISLLNWKEYLNDLVDNNQIIKAIQVALDIYNGKSLYFNYGIKNIEIQEFIKKHIKYLINSRIKEQSLIRFIANVAIQTDLTEFLLDYFSDKENKDKYDQFTRELFLIPILESVVSRPDFPPRIVKEVAKIDKVDKNVLEDVLLRISFPPSFTMELIHMAEQNKFYRILLHHFGRVYNNISPVFAYIIYSGTQKDISLICKYIFLSENFNTSEITKCVVLLFSNLNILERCFISDWDLASKYMKKILMKKAYIQENGKTLTRREIIILSLLAFNNAPLGKADKLFELLAQSTLDNVVEIPKEVISTIMYFIFESSVPLSLRENLFILIATVQYKDTISIEDHAELCISAGFSRIVKMIYKDDYEPIITSLLLSNSPNETMELLEREDIPSEKLKLSVCSHFLTLLLLDPKRFVKIIVTKFNDLHPQFVKSIQNPIITMKYYEQLFELDSFVQDKDLLLYLEFLSTQPVYYLIDFLRKKKEKLSFQLVYSFCVKKGIHIGCAVLNSIENNWNDAYEEYLLNLENNGNYELNLTFGFINNINKINENPSIVLRKIIQPITYNKNCTEIIQSIIEKACEQIPKYQIIVSLVPFMISCEIPKLKNFIKDFIVNAPCLIVKITSKDIANSILEITNQSIGKILSCDKFIVSDQNDGVFLFSTIEKVQGEEMPEKTIQAIKSIFQKGDSYTIEKGKHIPQDEEFCILFLMNQ